MNHIPRNRLSTSHIAVPVTYAVDIGIYDCENFILEKAYERYGFPHWLDHLMAFYLAITKEKEPYFCGTEFPRLRDAVAEGLAIAGYPTQSSEIAAAETEEDMNALIIRQYTDETMLYSKVNALLRLGHTGEDVGDHPLVAWILQANSAIRRLPEYSGVTYRGTSLSDEDLAKYRVGEIFVWSSFTSSSKSRDMCRNGNALFELIPVCALAEHDKRSGRDISMLSTYPEEEEVLLPICCAFRITSILQESEYTHIKAEIIDMN